MLHAVGITYDQEDHDLSISVRARLHTMGIDPRLLRSKKLNVVYNKGLDAIAFLKAATFYNSGFMSFTPSVLRLMYNSKATQQRLRIL